MVSKLISALLLGLLVASPLALADMEDDVAELQKQLENASGKILQLPQQVKASEFQKKIQVLTNDRKFMASLEKLSKHESLKSLLAMQLFVLVFMIVWRAWRSWNAKSWITRLWISFYCTAITWSLIAVVLPWFVLGEPFRYVTKSVWAVFAA